MDQFSIIQKIILIAVPLVFAITVHEVSHGWVAKKLGDPTAQLMGRLTLNPFKHIDPIGTLLVPTILFLLTNFVFGWAKPVPITWQNLKKPKRDIPLVALAGPLSNFVMAIIWTLITKLIIVIGSGHGWATPILYMGQIGMVINLVLMILNLIPLQPLDGGRVVSSLLPKKMAYYYDRLEPYGFVILIVLLATGVLGKMIAVPLSILFRLLSSLLGLPMI